MIDRKELFLGKYCTLQKINGFVLDGTVIDVDDSGVVFKTRQLTSYIAWTDIQSLIPKKE